MIIKSQKNIARKIANAELRTYQGKWIAVSTDGTRVIAAAESLLELDKLVCATGQSPESIGYERIDFDDDSALGGAELL